MSTENPKCSTPTQPNHLSHALSIMREIIYFIKIAFCVEIFMKNGPRRESDALFSKFPKNIAEEGLENFIDFLRSPRHSRAINGEQQDNVIARDVKNAEAKSSSSGCAHKFALLIPPRCYDFLLAAIWIFFPPSECVGIDVVLIGSFFPPLRFFCALSKAQSHWMS